MIRRIATFLLAMALFSLTAQTAAFATGIVCPEMQAAHANQSVADCAQMMSQAGAAKGKPAKHGNCTPSDCLSMALACGSLGPMPAADSAPSFFVADSKVLHLASLLVPLRGRSPPPDIQPPIA
jgi:hypothetical protein